MEKYQESSKKIRKTPLKAIRKHCLACSTTPKAVRLCESTECDLFDYRMGKNPLRKGVGPGRVLKRIDFNKKTGDSMQDFATDMSEKGHGAKEGVSQLNKGYSIMVVDDIRISEIKTLATKILDIAKNENVSVT